MCVLALTLGACTRGSESAANSTPTTALALPTTTVSTEPKPQDPPPRTVDSPLARMAAPHFDLLQWKLATEDVDPGAAQTPPLAVEGDRLGFFYADESIAEEIPATLVYANDAVTMWFADDVDYSVEVVVEAADRLALRSCRRSNRSWVRPGAPGIDGDPRIAILHLNTLVDTAGEFASYDLLPRSLFPDSNEREMVYIAGDLEVGSPLHIGTIAHEITHLLDYSYRPNRQLWLEEGIAQLVEHRIGLDTVLSAYRYVAKQPVQLNSWGPLQLDDRHYGAGFLYVLYLWEQYGDEAIHDLLVSDYDGIAAVEDVLAARDVDHAVFFSEWIGALVLDSTGSKDSHFQTLRLPQVCGLETVARVPCNTSVATDWQTS